MPTTSPKKIIPFAGGGAAPAFSGEDNISDWSTAWWHPTNAAFQSRGSGLFDDSAVEITAQQSQATADSARPDDWENYVQGLGVGDWDAHIANRRGWNDATDGYLGLDANAHYANYTGTFETFDGNAIDSEARMECHAMFLIGHPTGTMNSDASVGYIYSFRNATGSVFVRMDAARTTLEVNQTTGGTSATQGTVDWSDGLFHLFEATIVDNGDGNCTMTALIDGVAGTSQVVAWSGGSVGHATFNLFGGSTLEFPTNNTNHTACSAYMVRFGGILSAAQRTNWVSFFSSFNDVASFS